MPTFIPPTRLEASGDPFFGRYRVPVGLGDLDGLVDGEDYFLGGHVYEVSDEVAAELTTAGYTVG